MKLKQWKAKPLLSFLADCDLCLVLSVEKPLRSKAEGGEGWNALEAAPGGQEQCRVQGWTPALPLPAASIS